MISELASHVNEKRSQTAGSEPKSALDTAKGQSMCKLVRIPGAF